jgi:adenylate kinase family enzyme
MRAGIIHRYDISSVVFPSIAEELQFVDGLNLISGERLRNEFLTRNSELATTINNYIDNGQLIPKDLWVPFYTSLFDSEQLNIFCGLWTNLEHFKEFELYFNSNNVRLEFIKYYRINDIQRAIDIAVERYSKVFANNTHHLKTKIEEYDHKIMELCDYARQFYNVELLDYFDDEIRVNDANKCSE